MIKDWLKKAVNFFKDLKQFLATDLWRLDFSKVSRVKKFIYDQVLLVRLVGRAYIRDKLPVRASALTYVTLLSIVPVLALIFSILKGFGFHRQLEPLLIDLVKSLAGDPSIQSFGTDEVMADFVYRAVNEIIPSIIQYLDQIDVRAMGAIGIVLLLFSVMSMVNNIENSFNDIWHLKKSRSLNRILTDYISFLFLWPILIVILPSANAYIESVKVIQPFSEIPGIRIFIPSWFVFFFIYIFLPNTKVQVRSALWGGLIAGSLWQAANMFFMRFILTSYQTGPRAVLYTSFAVLPLFLIWLYLSWSVVLLGAEITYANQNRYNVAFEMRRPEFSYAFREQTSFKIILLSALRFWEGLPAPTTQELSDSLRYPYKFVQELLNDLTDEGLLYAVNDDEEQRYCPGKSLDKVTIAEVLERLRKHGSSSLLNVGESEVDQIVEDINKEFNSALMDHFSKTSLSQLVESIRNS